MTQRVLNLSDMSDLSLAVQRIESALERLDVGFRARFQAGAAADGAASRRVGELEAEVARLKDDQVQLQATLDAVLERLDRAIARLRQEAA